MLECASILNVTCAVLGGPPGRDNDLEFSLDRTIWIEREGSDRETEEIVGNGRGQPLLFRRGDSRVGDAIRGAA